MGGRRGSWQPAGVAGSRVPGPLSKPRISELWSWALGKMCLLRGWAEADLGIGLGVTSQPLEAPAGRVRAPVKLPGGFSTPDLQYSLPSLSLLPRSHSSSLQSLASSPDLLSPLRGVRRGLQMAPLGWGQPLREGLGEGWATGPGAWSLPLLPPVLTLLFRVVGRGHGSFIINMII